MDFIVQLAMGHRGSNSFLALPSTRARSYPSGQFGATNL